MVTEDSGLPACATPKLAKRDRLALVFVDPCGNKGTIAGSSGECIDEIAKGGGAAGHYVADFVLPVIVAGEWDGNPRPGSL